MDDAEADPLARFGRSSSPGVRFSTLEDDPGEVRLGYGTFDEILRLLHDLWWRDRRIGRLRLIADWIADRGLFDPEHGRTALDDPAETLAALRLARERVVRRSDPAAEEAEAALLGLIRLLGEATGSGVPVVVDRL